MTRPRMIRFISSKLVVLKSFHPITRTSASAPFEPADSGRILVDASDLVTHFGETGAGNEPDVPTTYHTDFHWVTLGNYGA
jgi:hypothetical protein